MRIRQLPTNANAPEFSDDCAECGEYMNSKMIGKDRKARCVPCHRKAGK